MDSVLEFDSTEIKAFKKTLKQADDNGFPLFDTFKMYAPQLFQNSF